MRRYVSCACLASASDGGVSPACDDNHNVTCGPIRRRCDRMLEYDVEAWLEDLSTVADCDVSRSLFDKNNEVRFSSGVSLIQVEMCTVCISIIAFVSKISSHQHIDFDHNCRSQRNCLS